MIEIDKQFENNLNKIKKLSALLKKNENKNTRVPLLVFNSITDERPEISISAILQQKDCEKAAYFGDLAGEFKNHEQKYEFFNIVLEIVNSNANHEMLKHFKKLDDFSLEVYILSDFLNQNDILKLDNLKIYKFESPDFIIELSNGEIFGIEITCASTKTSFLFSENSFKIVQEFKELKKRNQPGIYVGNFQAYEKITKANISVIVDHFQKYCDYVKNIRLFFNNEIEIEIFYVIPLGETARLSKEEVEGIKEIAKIAKKKNINFENIFVKLCHKEKSKWWNLEQIVTDLNLDI